MIYLKKNKQEVLHELRGIWREGAALLATASAHTDSPKAFADRFDEWFSASCLKVDDLVDLGSATMGLRLSHFPERWAINDNGAVAIGPGKKLLLWRHAKEPLAALVDVVKQVESAPEDSEALVELREHIEEFRVAVFNRLDENHRLTDGRLTDLRQLAGWTYDQVEHLYLAVVKEELKPTARKLLEKHGPRALLLAGKLAS